VWIQIWPFLSLWPIVGAFNFWCDKQPLDPVFCDGTDEDPVAEECGDDGGREEGDEDDHHVGDVKVVVVLVRLVDNLANDSEMKLMRQ
jgi:hypothetical protein